VLARLRRVPFAAQVLVALVLGVALGLVAREIGPVADGTPNWLTSTLATIGATFVTLLKALVPPLIVTAVIVSIANLKKVTNAARLAGQTLLWFAITALIAVTIGITLGLVTQPGSNSSVDAARDISQRARCSDAGGRRQAFSAATRRRLQFSRAPELTCARSSSMIVGQQAFRS
jgi:Na+/H+-dicarboxylate symporter